MREHRYQKFVAFGLLVVVLTVPVAQAALALQWSKTISAISGSGEVGFRGWQEDDTSSNSDNCHGGGRNNNLLDFDQSTGDVFALVNQGRFSDAQKVRGYVYRLDAASGATEWTYIEGPYSYDSSVCAINADQRGRLYVLSVPVNPTFFVSAAALNPLTGESIAAIPAADFNAGTQREFANHIGIDEWFNPADDSPRVVFSSGSIGAMRHTLIDPTDATTYPVSCDGTHAGDSNNGIQWRTDNAVVGGFWLTGETGEVARIDLSCANVADVNLGSGPRDFPLTFDAVFGYSGTNLVRNTFDATDTTDPLGNTATSLDLAELGTINDVYAIEKLTDGSYLVCGEDGTDQFIAQINSAWTAVVSSNILELPNTDNFEIRDCISDLDGNVYVALWNVNTILEVSFRKYCCLTSGAIEIVNPAQLGAESAPPAADVSDAAGALLSFCQNLGFTSEASLFLCGLILAMVMTVIMVAMTGAVTGKKGQPMMLVGGVTFAGMGIFNATGDIWPVWTSVVLITATAAVIAQFVVKRFAKAGAD